MHNYGHWKKTLALLVMSALSLGVSSVDAMPEGGVVRSGSGSVTQNGKEMTIRQDSGRLAMDWTGFSVGKDETVRFQQPGKDALALNRVTGNQQSVIDGSLLSNGHVLLVNPNGVVIGKNASIDVGGLVASTAQVKDNFMKEFGNNTGAFSLGGVSDGKIINEGTIQAEGGLVALHAAKVENSGTISNTGGSAVLAAADTLTLTPDADGKLNFTVDGKAAEASALNKGAITADGGIIVMTADSASDVMSTVVNNSGTLQARTLRKNEKGQILLEGGDKGQAEVSGTLDASGTEDGQSAGNIKVIGEKTIVHDGTNLLAKGNVDGGKIETSGDVLNLGDNLNIDAKGVNGKAGEWLLDPLDVIIADNDPTTTSNYDKADKKTAADSDFTEGSASIGYNDPAATDANVSSVNSAVTWISTDMVEKMLNAGTSVTVQAAATNGSANIIVKNDIDKKDGGDATLTLDAMRNITVDGNISSTSNKLNVVLNADSNGDKIGAVIINGNINTNGGDFTSASGGTVTYKSDSNTKGYGKGTLGDGKADPAGHTVGTYFGHVNEDGTADGKKDDRLIQTKGGKITLNGEIAIGLNGGTLTLDSNGGAVTATGIINSGHSYGAYVYGTTTWNELTADKVNEYLTSDTVPAYHYQGVNYVKNSDGTYVKNEDGSYKTTTDTADFTNGEPHYTFDKETDTQNIRLLGDGSSTAVSITKGKGYSSVIITEGKMSTKEYLQYVAVSDPAGFLSRYMTSNPTITVGSTSYALTVGSVTVNGVSNNALGYKVGNKFTTLTQQQIQILAEGALTLAKNSTDTTAMSNGITAYTNLTNDIKRLIASNWFVSETLAKYDPKTKTYNNGKSAVEDSYLATITTVLENSLTTPNGQQILWAGGRGSGVLNKKGSTSSANDKLYPYSFYGMPDDPTYQDGMYWVTGPEGEANGGKGTQFYSNAGSDWGTVSLGSDGKTYTYNQGNNVYGYVNWDTWTDKATATDTKRVDVTRSQPDNSSPFLSVGYGTTGKWDDAAMGGATTVGFIKETNLANSSLNIKAGSGTVNLEGDLGKAKALDTVNIESTGAVTLGNPNNTATTYHNGTVYADHGVYISGGTVTVGGEIHSGTTTTTASASDITTRSDEYQNTAFQLDSVTIKSAGDLTVHGVESDGYTGSDGNLKGGKISLTSTGKTGTITLGAGVDYNGNATDGTLAAASTAEGAVVVDAQGSQGSLVNSTTGTNAITTGKDVTTGKYGTWQVYVNSPSDYRTSLGSNLNSGTNAEWTARSGTNATVTTNSSGNKLTDYPDTSSNKFIFQVTPVITISGGNQKKTYGDTLPKDQLRGLLSTSATYTDSTGKDVDVTKFSNFNEADYLTYVTSSDGTKTGTHAVDVSSDGAFATATRTDGNEKNPGTEDDYKTASDGNRAFYVFNVDENGATALHGYDLETVNGDIEILKRAVTVNEDGHITYGSDGGIIYGTPTSGEATPTTGLKNGDTIGSVVMTPSTGYQTSKGSRNTADAGTYDLTTDGTQTKILNNGKDVSANYDVSGSGTLTVDKATLTLDTGSTTKSYGDATGVKDFLNDKQTNYTLDGFVNGDQDNSDTQNTIRSQITNVTNTSDALVDDTHTNNVLDGGKSGYSIKTTVTQSSDLKNYNVVAKQGNSVTLTPVTVTINGGMTQTYGDDTKTFATPDVTGLVNGDTLGDVSYKIKSDGNYHTNQRDRTTADAGTYSGEWLTTGAVINHGDLTDKLGKEATGNYIVTGRGDIHVEKATLTVNAKDFTQTYGNAEGVQNDANTAYEVTGFTNGDDAEAKKTSLENKINVKMDATDALKDNNQHTKDVNAEGYTNKVVSASGNLSNGELNNYKVMVGNTAKVYLTPKDIYTEVNGKGSTLKDLTWTIVKDPKNQMVNGDSVKFTYTPGNLIFYEDQTFDVNSFINGTQTFDSTTDILPYGKNYIFHSTGKIQLTFNPIVKPDVWAHSGGYRPRNKIETSLPVFRVEDAKVGQYGTYGVEHNEEGDRLILSATGMRLPEPDQVPDEERTFTTTLSTETGSGTFKLVYNGVSLKIYPQDKEAEETVRAGDKTKNVSLSEKALYVGYTEMGLDLIDLKGVYIYFN